MTTIASKEPFKLPRGKDGKIIIGPLPEAAEPAERPFTELLAEAEQELSDDASEQAPTEEGAETEPAAAPAVPPWARLLRDYGAWCVLGAIALAALFAFTFHPAGEEEQPPAPPATAAPATVAPAAAAPEGFTALPVAITATWDLRSGETPLDAGMAFRYVGVQQGDRCQGSVIADPAAYAAAITEAVRQAAQATLWVACADIGVPVPTPLPTAPPAPPAPVIRPASVQAAAPGYAPAAPAVPAPTAAELQPIPAPAEPPMIVLEDSPGNYHAIVAPPADGPPPPTPGWGESNRSGGGWDD